MIEIKGLYNSACVYTDELEENASSQIRTLCDQPFVSESRIRIMPDVHAGAGCTIGTTMTISDKIVPNLVGVDIGCGMETIKLDQRELDFEKLDRLIREKIPFGRGIRQTPHPFNDKIDLDQLRCKDKVSLYRAVKSIGTLGGGNHFIEVDKDQEGSLYLVIHSGSRHIGKETAQYYQKEAVKQLSGNTKRDVDALITKLKEAGRQEEISREIKKLRQQTQTQVPYTLCYVTDYLFNDYMNDMGILQRFADLNRRAMASEILEGMGLTPVESFTTIHNYIDLESRILRKGAVSAKAEETFLIPLNMRDGSLICIGKGNEEWNFSAPHGAGRLMSRKDARQGLSMKEFEAQMKGIYTTCVNGDTLDESPMAYKGMEEIIRNIGPTAQVKQRIRPVYNFKAQE